MTNQNIQNNTAPQAQPNKAVNTTSPHIALIIAAVILLISLFLPVASLKGEFRDDYEELRRNIFLEEVDIDDYDDYEDAFDAYKDVTIHEFVHVFDDGFDSEIITARIIGGAFFVLSGIILLFAILKKGIPVIVFCVFDFLYSCFMTAVLAIAFTQYETGYSLGIAAYIHIIVNIICFAFAIWLTVQKAKINKAKRMEKMASFNAAYMQGGYPQYPQQGYNPNMQQGYNPNIQQSYNTNAQQYNQNAYQQNRQNFNRQ